MTDFIRQMSALSPDRRQLLFRRLRQAGHQVNAFPLSFAQRRLWFLDQLNPGSPLYNLPVALRMRGPLQLPPLERSLNTITQRHAILRTRLLLVEEEPLQVIVPDQKIALEIIDFDAPFPAQRESQARAYLATEAQRPFDVANESLLRLYLLRLAEEEHILFMNIHHCIADGESIVALLEELKTAYQAFSTGEGCSLPALPIQYTDFTVWQHEQLQPRRLAPALAYWKEQLQDPLPILELPTDHPSPAVRSTHGATYTFAFSPQLRDALEQFSSYTGVTLFMTLLAAFQTVLFRYTGQTDLSIGSPISDRSRPETRRLIGLFLNTLALRTDLSGDPTFRELLRRVRKTCLGAYAHQQLPFDQLVEALHPERTLSHTPLFQTMFMFLEVPEKTLDFPGLKLSQVPVDSGAAQFDLSLSLRTGMAPGLSGSLEYRTDLFEEATIARLAGHFQTILEGILVNPEQRLSALPLLTQAEQQQLRAWNATETDYPHDKQLHELFEAQVQATPDATAFSYEETSWTYYELNYRANQLAHYLRRHGVGPDVLVALCVERSLDMLVGLLGILKAGGAYVPLDPSYPQERLAFMVTNAQIPVLVTQALLLARLPHQNAQVVCLDTDWATIQQDAEDNPSANGTAQDLAYVIYTSGSTGKPKGVQIPHQALVNLLWSMRRQPGLTSQDVLLAVTSLSFDIAALELFLPLIVGAQLIVVSRDVATDGVQLSATLNTSGATLMQATPSTWRMLLDAGWSGNAQLRMLCGGEALPPALATQLLEKGQELWNVYGPTETTIWSTMCKVEAGDAQVSIGRPLANTEAYVLDYSLQRVPIGVPGELYIGGAGLARGYLDRPELTAEKFIRHPFSTIPEARLYKTGDLVRYVSDGTIEFLGRLDHQIKLRGHRIELGEIESVLGTHPLVQESVVVVREDTPNDPRLVTYIVVTPAETPPSATQLRHFLAEKLPDYMLPAHIVFLTSLPLTPNGKTNRQALPAPDQIRPALVQTYVVPRTRQEKAIAQIWQQVLSLDQIGIHDNFFELGGHSLQTVQIVSLISAAFGQQMPVKWLFVYPTIASLTAALSLQASARNDPLQQNGPHTALHVPPDRKNGLITLLPHAPAIPATQVTIEHRPLLSLFATGQLAPVQAAAIASLPDTLLEYTGLSAEDVLHNWCQEMPLFQGVYETRLGRIALLLIPQFSSQLYHDQSTLLDQLVETLKMAKTLGAQTVSLTGLLPSATNYGQAVAERIENGQRQELPRLTTGHATTAASVILSVRRVLAEAERSMSQESVGVLGLGSIGTASLRLMLSSLPHPKQVTLYDVYNKRGQLEALRQELATQLHFQGNVEIIDPQASVPSAFYCATLIIGASNAPDILDIDQVQPGTLIVDDSAPHCFSMADAMQRFQDRADILFTAGGVLRAPTQIRRQFYLPRQNAAQVDLSAFTQVDPYEITGCIFSSLLSARYSQLPPTLGFTDNTTSREHLAILGDLGFQAAQLHCEGYVLEAPAIQRFRRCFGGSLERVSSVSLS